MKPTKGQDQVNLEKTRRKSTYRAGRVQKAPTGHLQKAPTGQHEKAPSYYISSGVDGVVDVDELRELLRDHEQHEWSTRVRVLGLMLLIEFFAKRRGSRGTQCC